MTRRRGGVLLAVVAVVLALFYWSRATPRAQSDAAAPSSKPQAPAVSGMKSAPPTTSTQVSRPTPRQVPQAPDLPFSFLGKLTEKGETVILLHGAGRTLRVRGPGPLTDDYEVTAIHDNHIVLRYVPLGTEQKLELATRANAVTFDSPADSPQD